MAEKCYALNKSYIEQLSALAIMESSSRVGEVL